MGTPAGKNRTGLGWALWAVAAAGLCVGGAAAEEPVRIAPLEQPGQPLTAVTADYVGGGGSGLVQAQCASCQTGPRELPPPYFDGCGSNCVAGGHCCRCENETGFGRLYCHLYNAFQCADPCYEPGWVAGANAALFVDTARPQTMMVFRYDRGINMVFPDRSEFFWAKIGGKKSPPPVSSLDYHQFYMYSEAGAGRFSFFTEMPYRSWSADPTSSGAGFVDLTLGTKTLLIDTEYAQLTLQTRTTLPTGSAGKGLSAGHVSLEPALILAAKLTPDTYFQGQIGEWMPIGGDDQHAGAIFNYRAALNHVIARPFADSQFIATLEMVGYCFQDGEYTVPSVEGPDGFTTVKSNGGNYLSIGPGLRWAMSQKCDFGFGVQFAVTEDHFAEQLYRFEFRLRF
jgi:hypothetical protein